MDGILLRRKVLPNHSMHETHRESVEELREILCCGGQIGGHVSECHVE